MPPEFLQYLSKRFPGNDRPILDLVAMLLDRCDEAQNGPFHGKITCSATFVSDGKSRGRIQVSYVAADRRVPAGYFEKRAAQ